jgi:integrase
MSSIRKRTWTARGNERSAWVVDYFDQAGKRRLKTFATRKEADAWSVAARHEVKQGTHTPASTSVTVAEATERWIGNCEAEGLEFSTIKQRRQHLNLHIAPFIGRERLSSLTTPRIYQFDIDLRNAGRSVAMRRAVLTNLKTVLTFAQRQGLVAQNVARGVKIKTDDRRRATTQLKEGKDFPSKAELKLLIDRAPDRWRPFLIVAVFTGMRASELRGLRWSDIDLDAGLFHVAQRADAWRHIGPPKSAAGTRDIPLVPMAINALRQRRLICPVGELGLAFPNGRGNIESLTNIAKRMWKPVQCSCGIVAEDGKARYAFHSLRHAAASLFIATLGWTPKRVQSVLGHASITMTFDRYGHLFTDRDGDKEAMKKLEAAIVAA